MLGVENVLPPRSFIEAAARALRVKVRVGGEEQVMPASVAALTAAAAAITGFDVVVEDELPRVIIGVPAAAGEASVTLGIRAALSAAACAPGPVLPSLNVLAGLASVEVTSVAYAGEPPPDHFGVAALYIDSVEPVERVVRLAGGALRFEGVVDARLVVALVDELTPLVAAQRSPILEWAAWRLRSAGFDVAAP